MKLFIIGGSAGAIGVLKEILPNLPSCKSFAVIVVLHLLPRGQSLLPEIFRKLCPWIVKDAESTELVENGVVYFAPSDYHLSLEQNRSLSLSNEEPVMFSRPSIDLLFMSAASVYKSDCTALLLSGANADGAKGFAHILHHGGRCLAQAPETAEFPEMPQAALKVSPHVASVRSGEIVELLRGRR